MDKNPIRKTGYPAFSCTTLPIGRLVMNDQFSVKRR